MKKKQFMICIVLLCMSLFSACSSSSVHTIVPTDTKDTSPVSVHIDVIKGPSSIGMIKLMADADAGEVDTNDFVFEIFPNADEIVPRIVQGKTDIAAVPPNMAAVLYNNTQGEICVIAIGTLGMMYVVENGTEINTIDDLRGRTVYAGFKGKSPEYDLNYILEKNGIDPEKGLDIEWKSEHTETLAALTANIGAIAVLPQPFATVAQMANEGNRLALDLNHEWDILQETSENPSALVTGVIVARKEFLTSQPGAVADFLDRYAESAGYVSSNVSEAAVLVGLYDIFPEAVAKNAIPYCNIAFFEGQEMKDKLSGYLGVLYEQNPQAVGGTLPGEEFYYER